MTDTDTRQIARDTQEQALDYLRQGQEAVVSAVSVWADTVSQIVPTTSELTATDQLPDPSDVIDGVYDFTGQVLAAQREFAHKVLAASAPAWGAASKAATRQAAAAKDAAAKARAAK